MIKIKRLSYGAILGVILALLAISGIFAQDDTNGALRFIHLVPGVSGVDVYTDGELTATNLEFGEATNYINVPTGARQITVRPTGLSTTLWQQEITTGDVPLTLIASSIESPQFNAYEDDFANVEAPGTTRFSIIHAIEGAPPVQLIANGDNAGITLDYNQSSGNIDTPAGVYEFSIISAEDESEIISTTPLGLVTSTTQMIVAYGSPDDPELGIFSAPFTGDANDSLVRIAHTVAGAPAVDVFAGDTMLIPALDFAEATEHLPLPSDTYAIEVRESGTENVLLNTELILEGGEVVTAFAVGTPDSLEISIFPDNITDITPDTALLSVVNTIPGDSGVTAELEDGTILAEELAFLDTSDVLSVDPSIQPPTVTFTLDGQSATLELDDQALYGGVYYNVFAISGTMFSPPTLVFAPTSLAQAPGSAPGAGEMMIVEADTSDSETTTENTETTTEDTVEPTATQPPVAEEVQPTAVPTTEPFPTVPPTVTEPDLPTARIILDPGVNLQLRQFPSTEALSLGLAPSGSTVSVVGREGAPIDLITGEEIIEEGEEPFADPVEALEEGEDLPSEETWVNIIYPTPDGGEISAWTLAQYLDIRTPEGDIQRLADLETVPRNQPGEALATDIDPPAPREDRVTVEIIGLDPGVNLNVRRTPETSSEVLARVPNGTIADLLGVTETGDWAFVQLSPAEGGSITGWLSTNFIQYQLNGDLITVEDLQARNLYPTAEGTEIGEVSAGAPAVAQPTVDPLQDAYVATVQVDADANLNLRRDPNDQAEVLVRIPGGSQIVIDGRTEDSEWLRTSFEGQIGWVASDFVTITFNGTSVELEELPVIPIEADTTDDTEEEGDDTENAG